MDVLTFHHKDKEEKKFNLSTEWGGSWLKIEKEIVKCELLCFNCHVKHHVDETKKQLKRVQEYYESRSGGMADAKSLAS